MFPLTRFRIEDRSMEPRMAPGDYVLVNTWTYKIRDPTKGEVVVLRDPEGPGRFLVKRIADVNGGGSAYVVGDNAALSRDSRTFGPVARDLLIGPVWRHVRP